MIRAPYKISLCFILLVVGLLFAPTGAYAQAPVPTEPSPPGFVTPSVNVITSDTGQVIFTFDIPPAAIDLHAMMVTTVPEGTIFNEVDSATGWTCENDGIEFSQCQFPLSMLKTTRAAQQIVQLDFAVDVDNLPAGAEAMDLDFACLDADGNPTVEGTLSIPIEQSDPDPSGPELCSDVVALWVYDEKTQNTQFGYFDGTVSQGINGILPGLDIEGLAIMSDKIVGSSGRNSAEPSTLYDIILDLENNTAAVAPIGAIQTAAGEALYEVASLAYRSEDNTLWGYAEDVNVTGIVEIDPETAVATLHKADDRTVEGAAWLDGKLWLAGDNKLYTWMPGSEIEPAFELSEEDDPGQIEALEAHEGLLYIGFDHFDVVIVVDPTSGEVVNNSAFSVPEDIEGLAFCPKTGVPPIDFEVNIDEVTADTDEIVYTFNLPDDALAQHVILEATVPEGTIFNPTGSTPGWNCPNGGVEGDVCTLAVVNNQQRVAYAQQQLNVVFSVTVLNTAADQILIIVHCRDADGNITATVIITVPVVEAPTATPTPTETEVPTEVPTNVPLSQQEGENGEAIGETEGAPADEAAAPEEAADGEDTSTVDQDNADQGATEEGGGPNDASSGEDALIPEEAVIPEVRLFLPMLIH